MSVHIASILLEPSLALRGRDEDSLVAIRAGHPRFLEDRYAEFQRKNDPIYGELLDGMGDEALAKTFVSYWTIAQTLATRSGPMPGDLENPGLPAPPSVHRQSLKVPSESAGIQLPA